MSKEGMWINYRTRHYIALRCRGTNHEHAIRDSGNQEWLGIPPSVIEEIKRFKPCQDREALLIHLMRNAPLLRQRCHNETVTFEFSSADDESLPYESICRWTKKYAGPATLLHIVNFAAGHPVAVNIRPRELAAMIREQKKTHRQRHS